MTIEEATHKFNTIYGPQVNDRVQAIGIGIYDTIHVYLKKRDKKGNYPKEFEGFKVEVIFTGQFTASPAYPKRK